MFVSKCNRLAFQFIESYDFVKAPSVTVIVGTQGLGKTKIITYLKEKMTCSQSKVICLDAEKFAKKYAFAAQNGSLSAFRRAMRSCDLLLLENVNILQKKKKTIEELFHTVDTILAQGGKIVMTYRGSIPCFDFLNPGFASRLKSGFTVYLHEPATDELDDFIRYYLADELELQEHIRKSDFYTKLRNFTQAITLVEMVKRGTEAKDDTEKAQSIARIACFDSLEEKVNCVADLVSSSYQLERSVIFSCAKREKAVEARYMAYLLLYRVYQYSYKDIAAYFHKDLKNLSVQCTKTIEEKRTQFETLSEKLYNNGKGY